MARSKPIPRFPVLAVVAPPPEKHVFRCRALLRVVRVARDRIRICVPAWNSRSFFWVLRTRFPSSFKFERGYRFHGNVNLAASTVADLDLRAPFEPGSSRVPTMAELERRGIVVRES